jgi:hypothetical protein
MAGAAAAVVVRRRGAQHADCLGAGPAQSGHRYRDAQADLIPGPRVPAGLLRRVGGRGGTDASADGHHRTHSLQLAGEGARLGLRLLGRRGGRTSGAGVPLRASLPGGVAAALRDGPVQRRERGNGTASAALRAERGPGRQRRRSDSAAGGAAGLAGFGGQRSSLWRTAVAPGGKRTGGPAPAQGTPRSVPAVRLPQGRVAGMHRVWGARAAGSGTVVRGREIRRCRKVSATGADQADVSPLRTSPSAPRAGLSQAISIDGNRRDARHRVLSSPCSARFKSLSRLHGQQKPCSRLPGPYPLDNKFKPRPVTSISFTSFTYRDHCA